MLVLPGISQPAPPTGPGGVPQGSILPYPTEEVMRRGILAFSEVSNIGETTEMTGGEYHHVHSLPFLDFADISRSFY